MSDYIHRVGRVGRVGSDVPGLVISFIQQKWEVNLLWKIEVKLCIVTVIESLFSYCHLNNIWLDISILY